MSTPISWVRRHRMVTFFGLAFLVSWWVWPAYEWGLSPTPFLACGPLVAALAVIGLTDGKAGYRALGARLIRWRVGWVWWVVAIGTPLAVLAAASVLNVLFFGASAPQLGTIAWSGVLTVAAIRFVNPLDGPIGEEPGWRGYAIPELQRRRSPLAAATIVSAMAALWHLPIVMVGSLPPLALPVTFAIGFVYAWLFRRTGESVLLTVVFHVLQGSVSYAVLGFAGIDADRMDWLTGGLWVVLAIAVVVLDRAAWRAVTPAPTERSPASRRVSASR
ncbi:CPBP family intramembrane glutamic endopeptidase [Nakamurella sp.]|uniref:CPBP family intramembrane glutamic endopeptidase n=1 Tax=Nakamurella sp. TaxID=1869182 RepID=UPI00378316D3